MISLVSKMYPIAVSCTFWVPNCFCVAHQWWLPGHISNMSWTLVILCNFLSATSFFNSKSFSVSIIFNAVQSPTKINYWLDKCHYYNYVLKGSTGGFRLSRADNVSPKRTTSLHSDSMWYDRECVKCHIVEIGLFWVHFLLLMPPVGDIR